MVMHWIAELKDVIRRYDAGDRSDAFWEEVSIVRLGPPEWLIEHVVQDAKEYFSVDTRLQVLIAKLRLRKLDEDFEEFHECMLELAKEQKSRINRRAAKWLLA
jgi:hypothetical protein